MEDLLKRLKKCISNRKECTLQPIQTVKIAIFGSRRVRGAQILLSFFKRMPEGQRILTSLQSAQRAKLIVNLVDRDGSRHIIDQASSDCEVVIIVQEKVDKEEKFKEFVEKIQGKRGGYPCQLFTVFNPKYHQSLREVYPILEGVQYSLCQYYQNIKVNAVSPDYSITQHFLDEFCCDK